MAGLGIPRSLHPEPVLQFLVVEVVNDHREDIADLALGRERDLGVGLRLPLAEEDQDAGGRMRGEDRKVHPAGNVARPVGEGMAIAHPESPVLMGMVIGGAHKETLARLPENVESRKSGSRFHVHCPLIPAG